MDLMMAEMKAKYQKEKQTDSSAPLSIFAMSISLALSPIVGVVLDRYGQVEWSQRHKKTPCAEHVYGRSNFPGAEKYNKSH